MSDNDGYERAARLLPAWFTRRMMGDCRSFAFILTNGDVVHLEAIQDVQQAADGTIWLDVALHQQHHPRLQGALLFPGRQIFAPTSRTTASINASHVMMAFETADT
jgi:hypothetical protein